MKKHICSAVFLVISAFTAHAKTVNVADFGSVPNDAVDDTAAVQAAANNLKANGGGTMVFPGGKTIIRDEINFVMYQNTLNFRIVGDKGAELDVNVGNYTPVFRFGNSNQVEFDGITFLGNSQFTCGQADLDGDTVILASYVQQLTIRNSQFFNLAMRDQLLYVGANVDLVIEGTMFGGNAAGVASVFLNEAKGAKFSNTSFIDYANYKTSYLSKTPCNGSPWIKAINTDMTANGNGIRALRISDSRFDEGALFAIQVENVPFVDITNINVNVANGSGAAGVKLNQVKYASIKQSAFGLTPYDRQAVRITNSKDLVVEGLKLGGGVQSIEKDAASSVTVRYSDPVQIRQIP